MSSSLTIFSHLTRLCAPERPLEGRYRRLHHYRPLTVSVPLLPPLVVSELFNHDELLGHAPYVCTEASFLTLITGSIQFVSRCLKISLESYAPSPIALVTLPVDDASSSTSGTNILRSWTSSFVTCIKGIFPLSCPPPSGLDEPTLHHPLLPYPLSPVRDLDSGGVNCYRYVFVWVYAWVQLHLCR